MPIYDLYCPSCKRTKEYFVDRDKADCLDCDICSTRLERKISAIHFRFKNTTGVNNPTSFKTKRKADPIIPINIVDANADGTFKVTSTSRDPEPLFE